MSLMATYVDGALQTSTTSSDSLSSSSKNNSAVDSDTFLTLLVAEMQNQDPLEPTSNTEWVSQYATFTQVEQMSEMSDSMDLIRANSLVGKEVIMKVTSVSTGETNYVRGLVDYVTVESGEAYLVIDEQKYSMDDLDTVASEEYFTAYDVYTEFTGMVDALPTLNLIDKSYENTIGKIYDLYTNLTEYQKNYVDKYASGYVSSYEAYIDKMKQFGITYGETSSEEAAVKEATLDDVLKAFNEKMEALMSQITTLGSSIQSSTSGNQSFSGSSSDAAVASGIKDATQSSGGTQDSGTTEGTQSSGGAQDSATTDGAQSSGETQNSGTTEGTQPSGETQDSATTDGAQSSGEIQNSGTTEGTLSSGGAQDSATTDGAQSSGETQNSGTTEGTQPSGETQDSGTEAGEAVDNTQSNDGTESSDAVNAAQTGNSEAESADNKTTDDMLDQLTQDIENT